MKYSIVQDRKMILRTALGVQMIPSTIAGLAFYVFVGVVGFFTLGPEMLIWYLAPIAIIAATLIAFNIIMTGMTSRTYANKDGKVVWTNDIQQDVVIMSIADKAKLTFEKDGVKRVYVQKHGVFFKHKRSPFYLYFPEDKRQEVLDTLKKFGWL